MIRRFWRLLADPPRSDDVRFLRTLVLPAAVLSGLLTLAPFWDGPRLTTLADVVWVLLLLSMARQRDHARAATRSAESDSEPVQASAHQDDPTNPPAATTGPPTRQPAATRNQEQQ